MTDSSKAPFIVFSMPRSRSYWLSHWLANSTRRVGHDMLLECDCVSDWLEAFSHMRGTVETAAIEGWRLIRKLQPEARLAVIFRPVAEVQASFARRGLMADAEQLWTRFFMLQNLARQQGVLALEWDSLSEPNCARVLWEHLLPEEDFLLEDWAEAEGINRQLDLSARFARIAERAPFTAALRGEVAAMQRSLHAPQGWN